MLVLPAAVLYILYARYQIDMQLDGVGLRHSRYCELSSFISRV